MSYLIVQVYSFACEHEAAGCPETYDVAPLPGRSTTLIEAHRELRRAGWIARRNAKARRWEHYCPEHDGAAS